MKCLISSFDLRTEGSLPLPPQHIAGTFQVPSLNLSNPCCQNWDILDPFPHDPQSLLPVLGHSGSPLASPVSSCLSPFSPSWRDWNLLPPEPSCIEAAISCPWIACRIPYPRCGVLSPMQRSRTGPPQPLPSTSRSHAGTPGGICPSPTFPGSRAGGGSLSGSGGHADTHEIPALLCLPR